MEITDEVLAGANRRGAALQSAFPAVTAVRYDRRIAHHAGEDLGAGHIGAFIHVDEQSIGADISVCHS